MPSTMREVKSCGVLVFSSRALERFLLMRHPHRYDLPKGHIKEGETELECALRELQEETCLGAEDIEVDPKFRYEETYYPRYRRFGGERVKKTLVVFLAHLVGQPDIVPGEHTSYEWIPWRPPHRIQEKTIDPLLAQVEAYLTPK